VWFFFFFYINKGVIYPTSGNVQNPLEGEKVTKGSVLVMNSAHPYYVLSSLELSLDTGERTGVPGCDCDLAQLLCS